MIALLIAGTIGLTAQRTPRLDAKVLEFHLPDKKDFQNLHMTHVDLQNQDLWNQYSAVQNKKAATARWIGSGASLMAFSLMTTGDYTDGIPSNSNAKLGAVVSVTGLGFLIAAIVRQSRSNRAGVAAAYRID